MKLNHFMNANFFRVFLFEPMQLFLCLVAVECRNFKLRLKVAYLSLKLSYLTFKCRRLVKSKIQSSAQNVRNRQVCNCLFNGIECTHKSVS